MKKFLTIACVFVCALMLFACDKGNETPAETGPNGGELKVSPVTADVCVTIANKGDLVVKQSAITATDLNDDKKIDIDEVLVATHKLKYTGEDGYASEITEQYGLSLIKLWGDTSGNFGYYVNNNSAWSLADEVKSGDYVVAFVYKNAYPNLDAYSYFDVQSATVVKGGTFELTLMNMSGYDENWAPIMSGAANASIVINGEKSSYVTDENGRVKLSFAAAGTYVLSATSDTATLVPAVCVVTVK